MTHTEDVKQALTKIEDELKEVKSFTTEHIIQSELQYIKKLPNIVTEQTKDDAPDDKPKHDINKLFNGVSSQLDVLSEMIKKVGRKVEQLDDDVLGVHTNRKMFLLNSLKTTLTNIVKLTHIINENLTSVVTQSKRQNQVQEGAVETVNITVKKLNHNVVTVMDECLYALKEIGQEDNA